MASMKNRQPSNEKRSGRRERCNNELVNGLIMTVFASEALTMTSLAYVLTAV